MNSGDNAGQQGQDYLIALALNRRGGDAQVGNGTIGTWVRVDGGSAAVSVGDVLVTAGTSTTILTVTRAVAAAMSNAGAIYGVALTAAQPGGLVQAALGGAVAPAVTGLGAAVGYGVLNTATARVNQATSLAAGAYPVGWVDAAGWLNLAPYLSPPALVTSVWPSFGGTAGGKKVTISGSNFSGSPPVTINGVPATSVVVVSPSTITCTTGACTAAGQVGNGVVSVGGVTGGTFSYIPGILYDYKADDAPNNGTTVTGNIPEGGGGSTSMVPTGSPLWISNALTALDGSKHATVRGNGSSQYFSSNATFTHATPIESVVVEKTIAWTNQMAIVGYGTGQAFMGPNGATPGLGCYAGVSWGGSNTDLAVGAYGIVRWYLSGASTTITVANGTPAAISAGGNSPNGTFYWMANNGASYWNGEIGAHVIVDPAATAFGVAYSYPLLEVAMHRDFGV